jgi:hypothetical protein
VIFAIVHLV